LPLSAWSILLNKSSLKYLESPTTWVVMISNWSISTSSFVANASSIFVYALMFALHCFHPWYLSLLVCPLGNRIMGSLSLTTSYLTLSIRLSTFTYSSLSNHIWGTLRRRAILMRRHLYSSIPFLGCRRGSWWSMWRSS
jgi:hypothetical protein